MTRSETQSSEAVTPRRKSARRFTMPVVVFGLLGGHMAFIVIAITIATGDRSFAVVPDYYQKAVAYDDRKSLLADSEALGWRVELQPAKSASSIGGREVLLRLTDREGSAVAGAAVRVSCYHFSNASRPESFDLVEGRPGQYSGTARLRREGFWWFEIEAVRGDDVFVAEFKQFVWAAGGER